MNKATVQVRKRACGVYLYIDGKIDNKSLIGAYR